MAKDDDERVARVLERTVKLSEALSDSVGELVELLGGSGADPDDEAKESHAGRPR